MNNIYFYIIVAFAVTAFVLNALKDDTKDSKKAKEDYYPYRRKYILTQNEYNFFRTFLKIATENCWMICPKVGLKDIFEVTERKNNYAYFMKIAQKHVDFLICDQALHPVFAIELDDNSHNNEKSQKSDAFKNKLYEVGKLKLVRIKAQMNYTEDYILAALQKNDILKTKVPET
ncbi:MAG: DUF2726 domain-containing protein [Oribacterium sp.]